MKIGVLLASRVSAYDVCDDLLASADYLVAADGGAMHAERLGRRLDILAGDFDSLDNVLYRKFQANMSEATTEEDTNVVEVPREKDETDAELALRLALELAKEKGEMHPELIVIGATGGRLDHELATLFHLSSLAERGIEVTVSDGTEALFLLHGPKRKSIVWPPSGFISERDLYVSSVAMKAPVEGLTYDGLDYPLDDFYLPFGSTRGVSNVADDPKKARFTVSLKRGLVAVIVTPERL